MSRLYVNDSGLTEIDPRTSRVTRVVPIAMPYNLYFTPDGSRAIELDDCRRGGRQLELDHAPGVLGGREKEAAIKRKSRVVDPFPRDRDAADEGPARPLVNVQAVVDETSGNVYGSSATDRSVTAVSATLGGAPTKISLTQSPGGLAINPLTKELIVLTPGGAPPPARLNGDPAPVTKP